MKMENRVHLLEKTDTLFFVSLCLCNHWLFCVLTGIQKKGLLVLQLSNLLTHYFYNYVFLFVYDNRKLFGK